MSLQTKKEVNVMYSRILDHIGINIYHMAIPLQMSNFLERHICFHLENSIMENTCYENVKCGEHFFIFLGKHQYQH